MREGFGVFSFPVVVKHQGFQQLQFQLGHWDSELCTSAQLMDFKPVTSYFYYRYDPALASCFLDLLPARLLQQSLEDILQQFPFIIAIINTSLASVRVSSSLEIGELIKQPFAVRRQFLRFPPYFKYTFLAKVLQKGCGRATAALTFMVIINFEKFQSGQSSQTALMRICSDLLFYSRWILAHCQF